MQLLSAFVFATCIVQSLYLSLIQNFKPLATSVVVQPDLCRAWSETSNTGFLMTIPSSRGDYFVTPDLDNVLRALYCKRICSASEILNYFLPRMKGLIKRIKVHLNESG